MSAVDPSAPAPRLEARRGAHEPEIRGRTIHLKGEVPWLLKGSQDVVDAWCAALPDVSGRLDPGVAELSFGNAVGVFEGPGEWRIEVASGKWDATHFESMLAELTAVAAGLPFDAGRGGALPYDRRMVARDEVLYHVFVYLRHILDPAAPREARMGPSIVSILRNPHRRSVTERRETDPAMARRVDTRTLLDVAAGRGGLYPVRGRSADTPLARALGGHLPRRVTEVRLAEDVDTPENRFVLHMLRLCDDIASRMLDEARRSPTRRGSKRVADDCRRIHGALRPWLRHGMWRDVGPMTFFPAASTVLQGRSDYRSVLTHFVRLRAASRLPLDEREARDLLELRDIATLYELWTFFTLVDVLRQKLGPPRRAERPRASPWHLDVPHEFSVSWPDGTVVGYNPHFSTSRRSGRRSYSVGLRPDIALELPTVAGSHLHLLDAKFRLRWSPADTEHDPAGDVDERRGDYKRADLYKMHTYRDAIDGARSVWILYPGTETVFYPADGTGAIRQVADFPSAPDGVGALPLRPEAAGREALEAWVGRVIE